LLNPPYKSDKKSDTDEYEFILANLDCLTQGGKCVAIVPMQEALATSGKVWEYKKNILEKHTLEAVFSMPDELFFNSKVNVVSCIMVFTAKRPHPSDKEVYFGYYKDDGFVKRKNKGRIDLFGKFENEIKQKWISNYRNHKDVAGLSVLKNVTADDEWCAEAYMETDYSALSVDDFAETIKQFTLFKLGVSDEK
jgi:type I restriction-modification system DNA methylase subunit